MKVTTIVLGLSCAALLISGCAANNDSDPSLEEIFQPIAPDAESTLQFQGRFSSEGAPSFEFSSDADKNPTWKGYFVCTEGGEMAVSFVGGANISAIPCDGEIHRRDHIETGPQPGDMEIKIESEKSEGKFQAQLVKE